MAQVGPVGHAIRHRAEKITSETGRKSIGNGRAIDWLTDNGLKLPPPGCQVFDRGCAGKRSGETSAIAPGETRNVDASKRSTTKKCSPTQPNPVAHWVPTGVRTFAFDATGWNKPYTFDWRQSHSVSKPLTPTATPLSCKIPRKYLRQASIAFWPPVCRLNRLFLAENRPWYVPYLCACRMPPEICAVAAVGGEIWRKMCQPHFDPIEPSKLLPLTVHNLPVSCCAVHRWAFRKPVPPDEPLKTRVDARKHDLTYAMGH